MSLANSTRVSTSSLVPKTFQHALDLSAVLTFLPNLVINRIGSVSIDLLNLLLQVCEVVLMFSGETLLSLSLSLDRFDWRNTVNQIIVCLVDPVSECAVLLGQRFELDAHFVFDLLRVS